jgi:glycosyltransferase involved in cell wall biosynthesis
VRPDLLVRGSRIRPLQLLTYTLIPLSAGMFPHIFIQWLTAKNVRSFRLPVAVYPLCIVLVWVPSVVLGVLARLDFPRLAPAAANSIVVRIVEHHAPGLLVGLLAAALCSAIMNSFDHQVLAVSTMFTQDIVVHYGYQDRLSERAARGRRAAVRHRRAARHLPAVAGLDPGLFKLGVWCFTGFAALFPILLAALFWRRSTKQGVVAAVLSVVAVWSYLVITRMALARLHSGRYRHPAGGARPRGVDRGAGRRLAAQPAARRSDAGALLPPPGGERRAAVMRIAYIAAGAADMYCGTCLHDNALVAAMQRRGHDAVLVPTYTPLRTDERGVGGDRLFFGALNVYLKQVAAPLRRGPAWVERLLDRPGLIGLVSRLGAATDPAGLGELTLSILRGEEGAQAGELEKLVVWLRDELRPDVVHLTNSMFAGFARRLKGALGVPVVCSLQGEELFLDGLAEPSRGKVRAELSARAREVDLFVAPHRDYADRMALYLGVERARIRVVRLGIHLEGYRRLGAGRAGAGAAAGGMGVAGAADAGGAVGAAGGPCVIGFLARIAPEKGLHLLGEGMVRVAAALGADRVRLRVAGYLPARQRRYLRGIERQLAASGLRGTYEYLGEVTHEEKVAFLAGLDVLAAPSPYPDPKGRYAIEALAAGVPVVAAAHGAFPDLLDDTGGGVLVAPGDVAALAGVLVELARDPERRRRLGSAGRAAVAARWSDDAMAAATLAVYESCLAGGRAAAGGGC